MILHYKKSHERFKNFFTAYPLSTDSRITHYLIFTSHVGAVADGSDVSSGNTTMSDNQQVLTSNSQIAVQPGNAQNNYLTQNLRANFNAAQRQAAAATTTALSNFQPLIALPPVLSNPLSVAPPATILSSNIPSSQNPPGYIPQQLQINTQKRPHESISTGDVGS